MSEESSFGQFLLPEKISSPKYSPISEQDDSCESETSLNDRQLKRSRPWGNFWVVLPWGLTALFGSVNVILLAILCLNHKNGTASDLGTFEKGFKTEFADARKHIEIVETWFDWGPEFRDNGTMYVPNPGPVRYAGDPHKYPDVNANWEELIDGRYFRITEQEAYDSFGEKYKEYWDPQFGAYITGIEMFHTLHCVNHLRRAYYPEIYYPKTAPKMPDYALMHRDHCIEHVRQYIMCHGDMTPTPTKYFKAVDRNYVLSDTKHTCRNFEKLQNWMLDRFNGPSSVGRYNGTSGMGS